MLIFGSKSASRLGPTVSGSSPSSAVISCSISTAVFTFSQTVSCALSYLCIYTHKIRIHQLTEKKLFVLSASFMVMNWFICIHPVSTLWRTTLRSFVERKWGRPTRLLLSKWWIHGENCKESSRVVFANICLVEFKQITHWRRVSLLSQPTQDCWGLRVVRQAATKPSVVFI